MSGYPYPQPSGLPTVQGLYDVLRSGHRNLEPDRESADAITAVYPDIGGCLRKEHGFASRAVTWAAQRGVGQYIVAAAGMPAPQGLNVHEIARRVLIGRGLERIFDYRREAIERLLVPRSAARAAGVAAPAARRDGPQPV